MGSIKGLILPPGKKYKILESGNKVWYNPVKSDINNGSNDKRTTKTCN